MNAELAIRYQSRSLSPALINNSNSISQTNSSRLLMRSRDGHNLASVSPLRSSHVVINGNSEPFLETMPHLIHDTSQTMISENISRVATQANDTVVLHIHSVEVQGNEERPNLRHFVEVRSKKNSCKCIIL